MKIPTFLACFGLALTALAESPSPNDQARFLAGLPVRGSALEAYSRENAYATHASFLDTAWARKEQRSLAQIRAWAGANGQDFHGKSGTVFYMFSGPDFLYANTFFPNASTYILCGTEPVGAVPDITRIPAPALETALGDLRQSMGTMLSYHYFITKEMRVDLQRDQLGGTLPILYVFLARLGCTIQEVAFVSSPAPGVRISFRGSGGRAQTLFYFKADLANGSAAGFLKWCEKQGPGMSLLKAASYLMHSDGFSQVRRFLLENSRVIVQDDSGIPLHFFDERFHVRLFGNYVGPKEIFSQYYQRDLMDAFERSNGGPLEFGFGYHVQKDRAVLMVATRK